MKKLLTALNAFLHPPKWVLFSASPVVFAALIFVLAAGRNDSAAAYALYGASAYCLTVLLLPLPRLLKSAKAGILRRVNGTAFGTRYVNDPAFRGNVGLHRGMAANFLYAVFRAAVGIRYASVWALSLAVYHLVLGALRLLLIVGRRTGAADEWRIYRRTARLLFLLAVPMGGTILLTVVTEAGYTYPGYVIYLSAMYTFYTAAMSVVSLVKCRGLGSPLLSAAKALNFVAALLSVLGLQTAMLAQFSADVGFRPTMNAITGAAIWLMVILTAAGMLHRSRKNEEVRSVGSVREQIFRNGRPHG